MNDPGRSDLVPSVENRNNASDLLRKMVEHGHGEVEMLSRRVTPPSVVAGDGPIGRTEVGCGDGDDGIAGMTPSRLVASDLITSSASQPVVE
jgi:hypothetical protein